MRGSETTLEQRRGVTVIALAGAVDVYTAPAVEERFRDLDPARQPVAVDLSRVTLIDSAGMRALVHLRNRATEAGRRVAIVCPRLDLRRVMEVAGLADGFVIVDDLEGLDAAAMGRPVAAGRAPARSAAG